MPILVSEQNRPWRAVLLRVERGSDVLGRCGGRNHSAPCILEFSRSVHWSDQGPAGRSGKLPKPRAHKNQLTKWALRWRCSWTHIRSASRH